MSQATATKQKNTATETDSSALEFTIDRGQLLKALGQIQSVVEKRNTIAILSNIKLEAIGGQLSLTTTDMDIAVTEKIPADIAEEGALTAPAHTLYEIIRKLPDGSQVVLEGDAENGGKLDIRAGSCNFTLSCLPVAEFPVMDRGDMSHSFTITPAELAVLIDKTRFAISTEETRYYLNGIFLHAKDEKLVAVATDGHRLAKVEVEAPEGSEGMPGIIIPRKTVGELKKFVEGAEDDIEISLSSNKISFVCGDAVLISKLIDGTFPDYEKVIPAHNDKVMKVSTPAFTAAVDRVSTISFEKTRAIRLLVEPDKLVLSATNEENGTANERLEVEYSGSKIDIGFNSRYVLDMMAGIEGETVELIFADGAAPVIVRDSGDAAVLYVIMPMRI